MSTKVLRFIGKGQLTIPQEWRSVLGLEDNVKATLDGDKIVIEPLPLKEEKTWTVEIITLNELTSEDRKLVKEGRKAYKKGKKEKFMTAKEFFKNE